MSRREFVRLAGATGAAVALGEVGLLSCARAGPTTVALQSVEGIDPRAIRDFTAGFHGTVIRPSDAEYDAARRMMNTRFDRRPGLIARCADAADVRRAVDFARAGHLLVAVRGGGHSFAGQSVCDGGLVIDLSRMKATRIDTARRVVRVQPGSTAHELDVATQSAGLALVLGGCGSVGIGGFTLGGGEGPLSGSYGLSCDNLLSAEVVLADGRLVTASRDEHPDLFWGIRGGGGNFGVVTSFELRAHTVARVLTGALIYDIGQAPALMRAYREFARSAPDALASTIVFAQVSGAPAVILQVLHAADDPSAESMVRAVRRLGKPRADTIAQVDYHAHRIANPGPSGGAPSEVRGAFITELSDEVIDGLAAVGAQVPPVAEMELNHLHGAVSRVSLADAAYPLRQPGFDCLAGAAWLAPAQRDAAVGWVRKFVEVARPGSSGVYVNLLAEGEDDLVKRSYGAQYARLVGVKRKYDPSNLFRLNPNVPPDA